MSELIRCNWCSDDPTYQLYHDDEWGVPVYDDRVLFEFLILEGAQAGLSWITILKKRPGYRKAFANFDVNKVARLTDKKLENLLLNPDIVRNRLKVFSTRSNAIAFIAVQKEFGSFSNFIWGFIDHKPIQNHWVKQQLIPTSTALSDMISKELKKRGFKFVGTTIIYAYMQAIGMVNDHISDCFRHSELTQQAKKPVT
ncbi:MAG: DNA-3-methyladenine glycosylase I [Spongiibacteraceae bacterium]